MGQFSDDGLWWWDGTKWIATSQIVLPDLPMTEFEQAGNLKDARSFFRNGLLMFMAYCIPTLAIALLGAAQRAGRDYRSWRLEQLALATAHLLGPSETMLAGEASFLGTDFLGNSVAPDLAVAVTAAHVLVFYVDFFDGQPRWVALAGRPTDVKIELSTKTFGFRTGTRDQRWERALGDPRNPAGFQAATGA